MQESFFTDLTNKSRSLQLNLLTSVFPHQHRYSLVFPVFPLSLVCGIVHYDESSISVFQESFASIKKSFILAGRLDTSYHSRKFGHFPDIS